MDVQIWPARPVTNPRSRYPWITTPLRVARDVLHEAFWWCFDP